MKQKPPPPRPFQHLSGEQLRMAARRADRLLSDEIDRIRTVDPAFQRALRTALAFDDESEARKNGRG